MKAKHFVKAESDWKLISEHWQETGVSPLGQYVYLCFCGTANAIAWLHQLPRKDLQKPFLSANHTSCQKRDISSVETQQSLKEC